jgi:hypothetical protein
MSDLTFEVTEFFQDKEMRFRAALAFATAMRHECGTNLSPMSIEHAVEKADDLLAYLDETAK